MSRQKPPRILIIAGSDSGGGAGIQADIKTVTMLGGHAMTAITAITAQNTLGVSAVHPIPTDIVMAQIMDVIGDLGINAIKIGMIGSVETANAIADYLEIGVGVPVIFDPVMVASSGAVLADSETIKVFDRLIGLASLTTPNLPELEALGGLEHMLSRRVPFLVKGGHEEGWSITDKLYIPVGQSASWGAERIETTSNHGTGCTLASAIATFIARGMSMQRSVEQARQFVRLSLRDAPGFGAGHGPMGQQLVREDAMLPGANLNQVTVPCSDYAASVAFYKKLGLSQIVDSPENGYARFEAANGVTFSIHEGGAAAESTVVYFESARLFDWCRELERGGLVFDQQPRNKDWKWDEARLRDPHGNIICLYRAGENRRYPPWRVN